MKYLFFVQTDGRGHMTQAITLKESLEKNGHTIVGLVVGSDKHKKLPTFFIEQFACPFFDLESPKFLIRKNGKGIKIVASFFYTIYRLPIYLAAIKKVKKIINDLQPDAVINFYEPLAGNYYHVFKDKRPMFCLGHQFFINHPAFKNPEINFLNKIFFRLYNYLTAGPRATKIALSFTEEIDLPQKNLFVCPPLIREVIKNSPSSNQNFILAYILVSGYSEEIITWSQKHPDHQVEAFWDKHEQAETHFGKNLTFHYLNGQKFIERLSNCSAYVTTGGFDSICEAAYLQKNILMIPTQNHFEQKSNAADAKRAGIAISAKHFDISLVLDEQTKTHSLTALQTFKKWVDDYDDKLINILEGKEDQRV